MNLYTILVVLLGGVAIFIALLLTKPGKRIHYMSLFILPAAACGSFQSFPILGSSRTFSFADPVAILSFGIAFLFAVLKKRRLCDIVATLGIILSAILLVSGINSKVLSSAEFAYPFKNFVMFCFIYLVMFYLIDSPSKLTHVFYAVILLGVLLCIQAVVGAEEHPMKEVIFERSLRFAGGLTWNSLVGVLSFIIPFPLILISRCWARSKRFHAALLVCVFVIFLFVVVLSGGRQALLTSLFSILLFVVFSKSRRKAVYLLMLGFAFMSIMYVVITSYRDFYTFGATKRASLMDNLYHVRLEKHFIEPLENFDVLHNFVFGDGISYKHNILTTVLYRFGLLGCLLFWLQMILIWWGFHKLNRRNSELYYNEFGYSLDRFGDILLCNFVMTNFIANLWFQVVTYGYLFWMVIGAMMGAIGGGQTDIAANSREPLYRFGYKSAGKSVA